MPLILDIVVHFNEFMSSSRGDFKNPNLKSFLITIVIILFSVILKGYINFENGVPKAH